MKTIKANIVIAAGIITAIIALLSVPVKAENLEKAAGKKEVKEQKEATINFEALKETEQSLLEDYIQNIQIPEVALEESTIKVYNTAGKLVYEGLQSESKDMINMSLFLVEFGGEKIYTLP